MIQLFNMPFSDRVLQEYGNNDELRQFCRDLGCDGVEGIWGGEQCKFKVDKKLIKGWHLGFFSDWVDFWNADSYHLRKKFGSDEALERFYGGKDKQVLLDMLAKDLERAQAVGAEYVVFHVSDVSLEECYTYRWLHTDEEIIDKSAELINLLLDGKNYKFTFLMENLHWAGFNFKRPEMTKRMLKKINYPNKGIMLDFGHLMCTNPQLKSEKHAFEYINQKLDEHGILCRYIKGIHLHKSLTGEYVKNTLKQEVALPRDYFEKFQTCYKHILNIDTHQPIEDNGVREIIQRINPQYLIHELAAADKTEKERRLRLQIKTVGDLL